MSNNVIICRATFKVRVQCIVHMPGSRHSQTPAAGQLHCVRPVTHSVVRHLLVLAVTWNYVTQHVMLKLVNKRHGGDICRIPRHLRLWPSLAAVTCCDVGCFTDAGGGRQWRASLQLPTESREPIAVKYTLVTVCTCDRSQLLS